MKISPSIGNYGELVQDTGLKIFGPITPLIPLWIQEQRSGQWPVLLKNFLKNNSKCLGCGRKAVTAHHVKPFHLFPKLELDKTNLVPVCLPCHFVICHAGDWEICVRDCRQRLAIQCKIVAKAILESKNENSSSV